MPIFFFKASINKNGQEISYYGVSEIEFKTRFYNHKTSFKHENRKNCTEFANNVWNLKNSGYDPRVSWSIISKTQPCRSGAKTCNLCNEEKLAILMADTNPTLNKKSELIGKYRHKNIIKLKTFPSILSSFDFVILQPITFEREFNSGLVILIKFIFQLLPALFS